MGKFTELEAVAVPRKEPLVKIYQSMDERLEAVKGVELVLNKQFKTDASIKRMGDKVNQPVPSIATGIYTFDKYAIGTGGWPRGRICEVIAPESAGKTTLCLHTIGQEQKNGGLAAFIDSEHALDVTWAYKLGVDVDNLLISQPDSGEQALETVLALVKTGAVSLVIVD